MQTPFIFGMLASGDNFTNRKDELSLLIRNFQSGINTILISPRRWGKSSLVAKAAEKVKQEDKNIKIVSIDLFNVRTEEDFYRHLAEEVLRGTTTKIQEVMGYARDFFKQWIPKVSFSPDHLQELSLGLNWQEIKKDPGEILDLAQNIASSRDWKIIVCIDEFQNAGFYPDSVGFQKQLRAHWQRHTDVSYCLFGSKRHMMMEVFTSPSMPFYKFGDLVFLEKITSENWTSFITNRFHSTGKNITEEQAKRIAILVECHPYYVQQLAQLCWLRCANDLTDKIIDEAFDSLMRQLGLLFQNLTESMTNTQINYLKALISGETQLSSGEVIRKYSLGTSANVIRIKRALADKEILDSFAGDQSFLDPVFKTWLTRYYFMIKA